ncbi:TetR/AcrR family transcriptional regulator [Nocardia terpenica]|uniref:Transcriptional regulator n=2 Tax=Nocardia terpenica TaxID=455432 RepID=A0A164K3P8_9NOCA|nr:TetR/AcrR family transcriptional regulator [Nocardia terpenica]ATL71019.1 TetR/AcrR family transcriptional regulator [Nocardia terpenica]KZM70997.1 transcriptional regulator [Nocardia terpenica]MBF6060042.1 TetR/AcrR family transcriptional regulator [Nocardia terpenica]MBF6103302.1 TetR/AcrR family transcriptional regulator [Nocardia terpenica]MBF6112324.1 TetR/AcrR family transcriptional regulator [Nocardia terpenica]
MYAGQPVEDRQRQRRARFLESGLTVFARDGYANSSVGAICKDAGLSSRQFYEEFTGRESLLLELYEQIDRESREAVAATLADHADQSAVEIIDAAIRAYVESIGRDPRKARVALVEVVGAGPKVEKFRLELRRAWGSLLASAAEDAALHGEIPPGDYEMRVLAIIGAVNYVVDAWSGALPRPELDDVIRVLRRVIIGAVSA